MNKEEKTIVRLVKMNELNAKLIMENIQLKEEAEALADAIELYQATPFPLADIAKAKFRASLARWKAFKAQEQPHSQPSPPE